MNTYDPANLAEHPFQELKEFGIMQCFACGYYYAIGTTPNAPPCDPKNPKMSQEEAELVERSKPSA